jgi:hypothetical protein
VTVIATLPYPTLRVHHPRALCPPQAQLLSTTRHQTPPHLCGPMRPPWQADEAMEVKEADASNDGHCATTLFHSARPSTEGVMPPSAPQRDSPPPVILPTVAGSSDLSVSSVASPSSEIKDSSSPHQPRLVVTATHATANPYALLDDEGEEKIASNDVQRASVPASSARPSRVETASSAGSKVAARVYGMEHRFRVPIKPVVAVDESPVNKRPCTRARPATTSTHGFFQRLATRPGAVRAHFEKHYLSTSRVCPCNLFPVYASKVEGVPTLPPELHASSFNVSLPM